MLGATSCPCRGKRCKWREGSLLHRSSCEKSTETVKKYCGKEEEGCSQTDRGELTVLVMAFSVQEGLGDLGSYFINTRSTRLEVRQSLPMRGRRGEPLSLNAAGCGMKKYTPL